MTLSIRGPAAALACATALLASGCSDDDADERAPAACLTDSASYVRALEAAPGEVRLEGTAISDCLTPAQGGGELAQVGKEMVDAATVLNAQARRDPTGPEAVRLGYLVGAVERGADDIHADLVLRINSAARFGPDGLLPAEFERTFGQGYQAGKETG